MCMFTSSFFKFILGFFLIIGASFVATSIVLPYFDSIDAENQTAEVVDENCDPEIAEC